MSQGHASSEPARWGLTSLNLAELRPASGDEQYQLHLAAIEYELSTPITIESKEDIQSRKHWSEKLEPFEHQVRNLITFCRRAPVALIADDVGLGKTISAGLILNELQTRRKVRRALILAPKMLLGQWQEELEAKFGISAAVGVGQDLDAWLKQSVPVVISTYESARDRMERIRAASFDMVILDEAHKLRNLHAPTGAPKLAQALHRSLANRDFKYVLMLTATPIQNRLWDLYSLVECLAAAKGHENPFGGPEVFVNRYVADGGAVARTLQSGRRDEFRRKLQEYMVRTSRREAHLAFPERHLKTIPCPPTEREKQLQAVVGAALKNLNSLARTSLAEALMSSPRALLAQVRNMVDKGSLPASTLEALRALTHPSGAGCKLATMVQICEHLRSSNPTSWRAVIFTRRTETLELIAETLTERGITVAKIRGDSPLGNQRAVKSLWHDPPGAHVIVSTDAGAVGLNLQVCNVVINFDLPWNPMVLEQRIGRVQRLGSKFKFVQVFNLTVSGSIEDLIVARLIEKLQAIAETVGDIEGILEASSSSDDDFEEEVRRLAIQALMGVDVSDALRKAQESIARAKQIYDAERASVESTLGTLDAMHAAGPRVPKLKPVAPRYDVRSFCEKAWQADGAQLRPVREGQIRVSIPGRAAWTATFDENDPDLLNAGLGMFGGSTLLLYDEGSKQFTGLTGEWRRREAHRILDRRPESLEAVPRALQGWADRLTLGLVVGDWKLLSEQQHFAGRVVARATASVSHDRFEKLCTADLDRGEHDELPTPPPGLNGMPDVRLRELCPSLPQVIRQAVEEDKDIQEFIRFYDARQEEEVQRAGDNSAQREAVAQRFATALAAELVGAEGAQYLSVRVRAQFKLPTVSEPYQSDLEFIPLTEQVLVEPELARCEESKLDVPKEWTDVCSVSSSRVLRHFLLRSEASGRAALPRFLQTCEASGKLLLADELARSEVSGKLVHADLLVVSPVSGARALPEEMTACEFTTELCLPSELVKSDVSGKLLRSDQLVLSAVSGKRGHDSEFLVCAVTGDTLLPGESGRSDLSGKIVRADLLTASSKNPERRGLADETVVCTVTGQRLLLDEAVTSAVSGQWVDQDLCEFSPISSRAALREEMVTCARSGLRLLPEETGVSVVSGLRVDRRKLRASSLSGRLALEDEFERCEFTRIALLPDEAVRSEVSGKLARADQIGASAVSGTRGHTSEFVHCEKTGDLILPTEAGQSDVSARVVRADLLLASSKHPLRLGLAEETVTCAVSGARLLVDEVETSVVSGRLADRELIGHSDVSSKPALPDELVTCESTGKRLLPDEAARSDASRLLVDRRLLVSSQLSPRKALETELVHCAFTNTRMLPDEAAYSEHSGLPSRPDALVRSAVSGRAAHSSECVRCEVTGDWILPSESGRSSVSGRVVRADLLRKSSQPPGRFGLPEETVICAATGKLLLADEVGPSAVSGRKADLKVLVKSGLSGKPALPDEIVRCEESSVPLLPDETDVCTVTGKRVDRRLLGVSDVSGRIGLARLLHVCPETRKRAFEAELVTCSASGLLVARSEVGTCSVSDRPVLRRLMVQCQISMRWLKRDLAVRSAKSGHLGHPDQARRCLWTGATLLSNEVETCKLTGVELDRDQLGAGGVIAVVDRLLAAAWSGFTPPARVAQVAQRVLEQQGMSARTMMAVASTHEPVAVVLADVSTLLGLRKRAAVFVVSTEGTGALVGQIALGRVESGGWREMDR